MNNPRLEKLVLFLFATMAAMVGFWAQFFPLSFYHDFPGFGMNWISVDGPYNVHLIGDVGGGYLALLIFTLVALYTGNQTIVKTTGAAWLVMEVPHAWYHLHHTDIYGSNYEALLAVAPLPVFVVLALWLILKKATPEST